MLRLSKLTDYGTVVMTYLARSPGQIQSAGEIAARVHLTTPTVSKLLKQLTREGLVRACRGARGGYYLSRPPAEITVAEIIQALEGPIAFTECCDATPGVCVQELSCAIRLNWQRINEAIRVALDGVTLAEMTEPANPLAVDIRTLLGPPSRNVTQ